MPMDGITASERSLARRRCGQPRRYAVHWHTKVSVPSRLKSSISSRTGRRAGTLRRPPPRFGLGPRIRANVGTSARRRLRQRRRRRVTGNRGDRRLRRVGLLLAARRRARGQGRHAVRPAVGFGLPGRGRRPQGRVPAAPRPAPHDPAAQDQLPGQRLGDALARASRRSSRRAPRARSSSPVKPGDFVVCDQFVDRTSGRIDTFYDGPIVTHLSSADDLRPGPARARDRHDPRPRHRGPRGRHGRRHPGPALLHEGRVEVVQRRRLGGHQHDPVPRGVAVPRARDGGRQHQP